jgi:hypothetical protein
MEESDARAAAGKGEDGWELTVPLAWQQAKHDMPGSGDAQQDVKAKGTHPMGMHCCTYISQHL